MTNEPIIIDVEASGFGKGSYPIEIGLVLPDGASHCFLVSPQCTWKHWDVAAEQVHGITKEMLSSYGQPVQEIAWRLNELLQRKIVYSDAWSFDMSWLGKLYDAANMQQTFTIADIADLMDDAQREHWDEIKQGVVQDLGLRRHRASGDARVLQETWRRLQRQSS